MASRNLARFGRFHSRIPLWKQDIPRYPVYVEGGPQNRVLLCHFWMKMIKPDKDVPNTQVHFEVHPQMSRLDIKQYLEKIYNVPVLDVRTRIEEGKEIKHPERGFKIGKQDDIKKTFVTLGEGQTFEFPDIFEEKQPEQKDAEEYEEYKRMNLQTEQKYWDRLSLPPWFR